MNFYYADDVSSEYLKFSDATVRDFVIDVDYKLENDESIYSMEIPEDELRNDYSLVKITFKK